MKLKNAQFNSLQTVNLPEIASCDTIVGNTIAAESYTNNNSLNINGYMGDSIYDEIKSYTGTYYGHSNVDLYEPETKSEKEPKFNIITNKKVKLFY